eukprot:5421032-Amphidinium_carterae.1
MPRNKNNGDWGLQIYFGKSVSYGTITVPHDSNISYLGNLPLTANYHKSSMRRHPNVSWFRTVKTCD